MVGIYMVEAADWLRAVGLTVYETDDWETRARSSGGFAAMPLGIQWHHTASSGQHPAADIAYMSENAEFAPIGNVYLAPDGAVTMIAAGAANTAGKGGPYKMSRGTVPLDKGNTTTWAVEAANNGVGQMWPRIQIDAYFIMSNELNRRWGNEPGDLFTHQAYTSRKIDPARADVVQGPWRPRANTSAGSWNVTDVQAEARKRATTTPPPPTPPPLEEEDDMLFVCKVGADIYVGDGVRATKIPAADHDTLQANMDFANRWHHPARAGLPLVAKVADIPVINAGQRDLLVGKV